MTSVHAQIAPVLVFYFSLLGVWGLFLGLRRAPMNGSYRAALALGVLVGAVQIVVGLVLLLLGFPGREPVHYLYGLTIVGTLPLVRQYIAHRRMRAPLAYGIACLFLAGVAIRGITTGRPPL